MTRKSFILLSVLCLCAQLLAQNRTEIPLRSWMFSHDNTQWEAVTIPHDWAIKGPFDKKWDLQRVAIAENGETESTEKSGRSGALPWIGKGFYKTTLTVDKPFEMAELLFDGAMSEPVVCVNGTEAGRWAYGYNAFRIDISKLLKRGENTIEVHLNNVEESSRWYPGGGLYRPVTLIMKNETSIDDWSTYIRTMKADADEALVAVDARLNGAMDALNSGRTAAIEIAIIDAKGNVENASHADVAEDGRVHADIVVRHPQLWAPETPYLYTVRTRAYVDNQLVDEYTQKLGIRTLSFSKEHGFQLNGVSRKFQGVCLHHDLGPLGAAVNKAALIRQVKILKDMGCDAIRTAHNMPSTWQMEVYDSLGMMVMAESFDMWIYPKCKNGYARFFKEWSDRDIENLVLCHRNHPSLVMWSIGNEIPEQWSEEGRQISLHLQELCHKLDPSRPVTQGMDKAEAALKSGFAQVMDIPGFNYRVFKYANSIKQLPQGFLLGSETASTVSSRGVYKFPVVYTNKAVYPDGQCSSYDVEYCSWSNVPEEDFVAMDDLPYTIGQFVWTGFDYLGEPTPYDEYWPSRSSYFGICDLAGLPKDRYYLYRSVWNKEQHTIHLLPHWTWHDRVGQVTPVYCYTDYPSAELFVNGKSQGRITKHGTGETQSQRMPDLDRYRLRWNDVVYEPGELKVVVYDAEGNKAGEQTLHTAGNPAEIKLTADRTSLRADGDDLVYVEVCLVDKDGNELPTATDLMTFEVSGAGSFRGVCNGDATSTEPFTEPQMHLFSGKLVVTLQASDAEGTLKLVVKDKDNKRIPAKTYTIKVEK